jgi:hypothetical protein
MDLNGALNHPWTFGLLTVLFLALLIEVGYWTTKHFHIDNDESRNEELEHIRDGLFLLLSLLLGFTLALAAPRYLERRTLLVDEANAIGSTYLRAGVLPKPQRERSQQLLAQYVDVRLEFDKTSWSRVRTASATERAKQIQTQLWATLMEVTSNERSAVASAYMTSLNELIDLHEKRLSALENRIPGALWVLDLSISALAAFSWGLTIARHFWLAILIVPVTIAIVVVLIADLDTPSKGLIRVDQGAMLRLKADMADVSQTKPEVPLSPH